MDRNILQIDVQNDARGHTPEQVFDGRGLPKIGESSIRIFVEHERTEKPDRRIFAPIGKLLRTGGKIIALKAYAKSKGEKGMMQSEKEKELKPFKPGHVSVLCEKLEEDTWALKALSALMETSHMNHFSEDLFEDAWLYRQGLKGIIEMYLDRQKKRLKDVQASIFASPDWLIAQAETSYEFTNQGAWESHDVALENTQRHIQDMNRVITEFGAEGYPKAQKMLERLLNLQDGIKSRICAEEVAKTVEDLDYKYRKAAAGTP